MAEALHRMEQVQQAAGGDVLFRGEATYHATRLPTAARGTIRDRWFRETYLTNLSQAVFDELIQPHVQEIGFAPHFRGRFIGCYDLLGRVGQETYIEAIWQLQALLQHYDRQSAWLDVTFDPRVALFFACFDAGAGRILRDGIGYIHFIRLEDVSDAWSPVIDLRSTADLVAEIVNTTAERPRVQSAGAMRYVRPLATEPNDGGFQTIVVRRGEWAELFNPAWFFPDEKLVQVLNDVERHYLNFLKPIAASGRYQDIEVGHDFVSLCDQVLVERRHLLT